MRRALIYIAVILAFFIGGVIIANFIIMPLIVHRGREIVVPNVTHLPVETAIEELKKKELDGVVTERRHDPIVEEGKVITQEPLPDAKVKKGRLINLTVSLGPETVKIPHLIGVDIDKGQLIMKRLGFVVESSEYVFSDTIPRDKIIQTIPGAEVELRKGENVKLIVSKGPELKMPNLSGMDIDEAKILCNKLGLVLAEIKEVEGSGTKGSILVQNPAPGQVVSPGDSVSVMVIK